MQFSTVDYNSDHFLVTCELRLNIEKLQKPKTMIPKLKYNKFHSNYLQTYMKVRTNKNIWKRLVIQSMNDKSIHPKDGNKENRSGLHMKFSD